MGGPGAGRYHHPDCLIESDEPGCVSLADQEQRRAAASRRT